MTLPCEFLDRPIAHRALHGAAGPENSRAAIQAAIDAGYGIEIDIQPAKCGTAMVFHDYMLERLTGTKDMINQTSLADLRNLRLIGSSEAIPTLREVLDLVKGRVPLLVEIKDQDGALGPDLRGLEEAVAKDITGYVGPLAVMSFNPHSVNRFARLSPQTPRGMVTCAFDHAAWPHVPAARRVPMSHLNHVANVDFISHHHLDLGNPSIGAQKADGLPVLCWTIRSPAEETEARKVADNVTFESYLA